MSNDHSHGVEVLEQLRAPSRDLRAAIPDVYSGFSATHRAALEAGVLDARTKELIALGISVAQQCDGCMASHARGAAMKGATAEEVAEALAVAILMGGGPATVHGPRAYAAFLEFRDNYART